MLQTLIKEVKIGLIQPENIFFNGIINFLNECDRIDLTFINHDFKEIENQLKSHQIDILITEYEIIDYRELLKKNKSLKILALTTIINQRNCLELIHNGIHGYINRDVDVEELCLAINCIINNGTYFDPNMISYLLCISDPKNEFIIIDGFEFTRDEFKVMQLIYQELSSKEIADYLNKSKRTIDAYRRNIVGKIDAKNGVGIAKFLFKNQLIFDNPNKIEVIL